MSNAARNFIIIL